MLAVAFLAALALIIFLTVIAIGGLFKAEEPTLVEKTYPYNPENLVIDGDRASYTVDGNVTSKQGIDVSDHNGDIDWDAVKNDGIDFAFIRIGYRGSTEGEIYEDATYAANIENAQAAGIKVGVYFYSQATNVEEAEEEARETIELLGGRSLEMPVVFDHEPGATADGRAYQTEGEALNASATAFVSAIKNAGYEAMLYGNTYDLSRYSEEVLANNSLWFAEYGVDFPDSYLNYTCWQYNNAGNVDGIPTTVDMNLWFKR